MFGVTFNGWEYIAALIKPHLSGQVNQAQALCISNGSICGARGNAVVLFCAYSPDFNKPVPVRTLDKQCSCQTPLKLHFLLPKHPSQTARTPNNFSVFSSARKDKAPGLRQIPFFSGCTRRR